MNQPTTAISKETVYVKGDANFIAPQIETPKRWYAQMDGLRFLAVTAVMIEHFAHHIGQKLHMGFFGVDLFFVISGFLITEGLLIDKRKKSPGQAIKRFYYRRFLRIFPIYYLLLIVSLLIYPPFQKVAAWAFTYTINYYRAFTGEWPVDPYGHLWTLSIEEQFYLFWPCVVLLTPRKFFLPVLTLIFSASLIYFLSTHDWFGLQGRMYSLCLGAFLAFAKTDYPEKYAEKIHLRFLFVFVIAVGLYFYDNAIGMSVFSLGLVYLGSNNAFVGFVKRFFENKKILHVGKISYGVYLYHIPLMFLMDKYVFNPVWQKIDFGFLPVLQYNAWIFKLPLYALLSIAVAHISFRLIEQPILKYKNRFK